MEMILAVDVVTWARAQMAFTLAFHIILVPARRVVGGHGADRQLPRDEARRADAMRLAQRWSKYMAVTFAVARSPAPCSASSSACFGRSSWASGAKPSASPSRFEGLFFFTEAIFIAIYIYGWRRLPPWPTSGREFLSSSPASSAGVGGRGQRLDELAEGFTLDAEGEVDRGRPDRRDLQRPRCHSRPRTWWSRPTWSGVSSWRRSTRSGCCGGGVTATTASGS